MQLQKKKPSPCTVDVKGWSEAQCETANEDKRGQDSPGPNVTHSQGDMAHYDSPFAVGWEHKRQSGGGVGVGWVNGGVCVWVGWMEMVCVKRKDSSLQMGKKGQLVTKSLVQPSLPQGRIPLWSDPLWRFPQIFAHRAVHRQRGIRPKRGVFRAAFVSHQLCLLT